MSEEMTKQPTGTSRDERRRALLAATLRHVPFDGWTVTALQRAAGSTAVGQQYHAPALGELHPGRLAQLEPGAQQRHGDAAEEAGFRAFQLARLRLAGGV